MCQLTASQKIFLNRDIESNSMTNRLDFEKGVPARGTNQILRENAQCALASGLATSMGFGCLRVFRVFRVSRVFVRVPRVQVVLS